MKLAPANPLAGVAVHLGCHCRCGSGTCHIGQGREPHRAELRCAHCDRYGGWLPHVAASSIEQTIQQLGRATQPIVVRPSAAMRHGGNFQSRANRRGA
jgi:hypothetical protein